MTVITLSTVGYEEVHRLDSVGRLFTVGVIITGFGTLVYAAATLSTMYTSGQATVHLHQARGRRMRHAIRDHVIVVGFGRVGQAAAGAVRDLDRPCLVIDRDPALEHEILEAGFLAFTGDATNEADLAEAGIERATALVAAAEDDDINLVVTLTARALRPNLRIVSRVNEAGWRDRIIRAGADVAQSPYRSYGMSLAASALTPAVLEVHSLPVPGLATEEIEVSTGSPLVGRSLSGVGEDNPEIFVIGLRRDRRFQRWHELEGAVAPGDVLVVLGAPEHLWELARRSAIISDHRPGG
jgi:voltage-gated potassium channel